MSDEANLEPTIEQESVEDTLGLEEKSTAGEELQAEDTDTSDQSEVQAETVEELEEEIAGAIEDGATAEEVKSMIKEFELKVNGKTFTKKLDLSDEEAVKRELQKAYAGQQAMQQKAELEKSLQERVAMWKNDPNAIFADLGLDPEEYLTAYMDQKLEESKKTPEQLEREKIQKELEEYRRREKEMKEKLEQEQYSRLQEKAAQELDEDITKALDAHKTLPNSPRVVAKIADTMKWAIDNGYPDVTAADVVPTVEKELQKEIQDMLRDLPAEVFEAYVGKNAYNKFKKEKLGAIKKKPETLNEIKKDISIPTRPKEEAKKKPRRSVDDFMRAR